MPFPFRIPEDLCSSLEGAAQANGRSVNAEIVATLDAAMGGQSGLSVATLEALLDNAAARLGTAVQINVMGTAPVVPAKTSAKPKKA